MKRLIAVLLATSCLQVFAAADAGTEKQDDKATAAANKLRRVHVFVSGRVQGVGFRDFVKENAQKLKLTGWVRNLSDRRVELVAEGPGAAIDELLKAVAKGPPAAKVEKAEPADEPYTGEFKTFERIADK